MDSRVAMGTGGYTQYDPRVSARSHHLDRVHAATGSGYVHAPVGGGAGRSPTCRRNFTAGW